MVSRQPTKRPAPPAPKTAPARTEPAPIQARVTPAQLAKDLLREYPDELSSDLLAVRAEAAGLKPQTVARVLDRLRTGPTAASKVQSRTIDPSTIEVTDLTELPSIRTRIKGSAYSVTDTERARYGGTEYLLVREQDNPTDLNAVAVYGNGHRVGYLSQARAASTSPLLAQLPGDAFRVTGTGTTMNSIILWVDVPRVDALRKFRESS